MIVVANDIEKVLAEEKFPDDEILVIGCGGMNVVNSLKDVPRDTPIINFGHAGSNNIALGTEVHVSTCTSYSLSDFKYESPVYELEDEGVPCYTAGDFVTACDIEEPCVFDMELGFILALGFTNVRAIKLVSDNLSLDKYNETISEVEE